MLSRTLLLSLLVFTPALAAQEMGAPKPAKELAKLEKLVGHYEGSGTVLAVPGAPMMPWTARSSYTWGFGKHWLLEHTKIEMEDMPTLEFHGATGWDREAKRFIGIWGSNMGQVMKQEIDFFDDNKMITVQSSVEEGNRVVETSVTEIGKDGFSFKVHRSVNGGKPELFLEGTFKRAKKFQLTPTEASFPMPTKIPELERLAGMQGKYRMTGKMIPMPGMESMAISGTEEIILVSGGTLLLFKIKGDPVSGAEGGYESMGAMAWDKKRNCYSFVFVNNMGEGGKVDGYYNEETRRIVYTHSGTMRGKPYVMRSVMQLDRSGVLQSTWSDSIHGSAKPTRAFEGKFEKLQ